MEVKRYQKNKRIEEAVRVLHTHKVPFTRHNEDTQFNIRTKLGLMTFWPTKLKYRIDGYTTEVGSMECLIESLQEIYGYEPNY